VFETMVVRRTLTVLVLVLTVWNVEVSADITKSLDELLLKMTPLGDPKTKYPDKADSYLELCNQVAKLMKAPSTLLQFTPIFTKVQIIRDSWVPMIKEKVNNKLCEIAKANETEYNVVAKEFNEVQSKMIPIRKKMTNALVAAATLQQTITGPEVGCFYRKWMDESEKTFKTDFGRVIFKETLRTFMNLLDKLKPSYSCDWSKIPDSSFPKIRSIEMLYFDACKNIFLEQPKAIKANARRAAKEAAKAAYKEAMLKPAE